MITVTHTVGHIDARGGITRRRSATGPVEELPPNRFRERVTAVDRMDSPYCLDRRVRAWCDAVPGSAVNNTINWSRSGTTKVSQCISRGPTTA